MPNNDSSDESKPVSWGALASVQAQGGAVQDAGTEDLRTKIEEVLDQMIRPAVRQDGGFVDLVDVNPATGLVTIRLSGACNGCPSSSATLKFGIESTLKDMIPEVKTVEAVA